MSTFFFFKQTKLENTLSKITKNNLFCYFFGCFCSKKRKKHSVTKSVKFTFFSFLKTVFCKHQVLQNIGWVKCGDILKNLKKFYKYQVFFENKQF